MVMPDTQTSNNRLETYGSRRRSVERGYTARAVVQPGSWEKRVEKRRRSIKTPKGFHDKAQGRRVARHPG